MVWHKYSIDKLRELLSSISFCCGSFSDFVIIALDLLIGMLCPVEAVITNKYNNDEEGNSCKANAERVGTTIPKNNVATAMIDVHLYGDGNSEANGNRVLRHR